MTTPSRGTAARRARRLLSSGSSLVLTVATVATVLLGPPTTAATAHLRAGSATVERHVSTDFAFYAMGHGTKARGGQVPVGSRLTAFQAIGCTNLAGLAKENHVTDATLPGAGTATGITTTVATRSRHGVVSSITRTSVAELELGGGSGIGTVTIRNISSVAVASHGPQGYRSHFASTIGSIVLTSPLGTDTPIPVPSPGQSVDVPGLLHLNVGKDQSRVSGNVARGSGFALAIQMIPSDTKVDVGRARSIVAGDILRGLFHGSSAAVETAAMANNVSVGRQPLSIMPCQGTQGVTHGKDLAGITLDGGLVIQGLHSAHVGDQTTRAAAGRTIGDVASVNLGSGQMVIRSIKGVAHVERTAGGVRRDIRGSSIGSVTVNGQSRTFPPSGVLEIPGVARLERNITHKTTVGISVVALRITLLDGSGAVIDLGTARLAIRKKL